jgi:Protein of unknown function (DUF2867)
VEARERIAGRARVTARQVAVPRRVRARSSFAKVDYEDACVLRTGRAQDRTAEDWARAMLEGASPHTQTKLRTVWLALGLKLGPTDSKERVLGWKVRRSNPDAVVLAAKSGLGLSAEVLVERRRRSLLAATFLQQHNPIARAIWFGIAPGHRQTVRRLLEAAVQASGRSPTQ